MKKSPVARDDRVPRAQAQSPLNVCLIRTYLTYLTLSRLPSQARITNPRFSTNGPSPGDHDREASHEAIAGGAHEMGGAEYDGRPRDGLILPDGPPDLSHHAALLLRLPSPPLVSQGGWRGRRGRPARLGGRKDGRESRVRCVRAGWPPCTVR